jgi:hypothetical protein
MQHRLHVRRTPSSPAPALIRCELHAEDFPSSFHSLRAASFLCSPCVRDQPSSTEPYHCAVSARAAAPRAPPPPSSPEPTTLSSSRDAEESYRTCAVAAKSLRDASPHQSSSGHVCTTLSTAWTPDAFPPQQPAASDRRPPPPRRSPPADHPPPWSTFYGELFPTPTPKSGSSPRRPPPRPVSPPSTP